VSSGAEGQALHLTLVAACLRNTTNLVGWCQFNLWVSNFFHIDVRQPGPRRIAIS